MDLKEYHLRHFAQRLATLSVEQDAYPDEYDETVEHWVSSIHKSHRPTAVSVVMNAKRIRWGEELIC